MTTVCEMSVIGTRPVKGNRESIQPLSRVLSQVYFLIVFSWRRSTAKVCNWTRSAKSVKACAGLSSETTRASYNKKDPSTLEDARVNNNAEMTVFRSLSDERIIIGKTLVAPYTLLVVPDEYKI